MAGILPSGTRPRLLRLRLKGKVCSLAVLTVWLSMKVLAMDNGVGNSVNEVGGGALYMIPYTNISHPIRIYISASQNEHFVFAHAPAQHGALSCAVTGMLGDSCSLLTPTGTAPGFYAFDAPVGTGIMGLLVLNTA